MRWGVAASSHRARPVKPGVSVSATRRQDKPTAQDKPDGQPDDGRFPLPAGRLGKPDVRALERIGKEPQPAVAPLAFDAQQVARKASVDVARGDPLARLEQRAQPLWPD